MEKIKISATVEWAFLNKPNEMSGKYQLDLTNLSDKAVKALAEMGIKAAFRDDKADKGHYITCKSARPIKAYGEDGKALGEDILVGNGSKATAVIGYYDWQFKNKKGRSPSLGTLVITDLKQYGGSGDIEDVDDPLNDDLDGVL